MLSVKKSIENFEKIKKHFKGNFNQEQFDTLLKSNMKSLGSQITTALSLAFFSKNKVKEFFPNLLGNVFGGGVHAGTKMNLQEILVLPKANSIKETIETNVEIWSDIKEELKRRKISFALNHESAWTADLDNERALSIVSNVAEHYNAKIGVDFAASQLYRKGKYVYGKKRISRERQIDYVNDLRKRYKLFYLEDPLHEDDFLGFREISAPLVCGDDLIASNLDRFWKAMELKSVNAVIVKPNQVGNVTDCLKLIDAAHRNKMVPIVSHRSGETADTAICKLAQFTPLAKLGVTGMGTIKLNELINMWDSVKNPKMRKLIVE